MKNKLTHYRCITWGQLKENKFPRKGVKHNPLLGNGFQKCILHKLILWKLLTVSCSYSWCSLSFNTTDKSQVLHGTGFPLASTDSPTTPSNRRHINEMFTLTCTLFFLNPLSELSAIICTIQYFLPFYVPLCPPPLHGEEEGAGIYISCRLQLIHIWHFRFNPGRYTVDSANKDPFYPVLTLTGGVTMVFLHEISYTKYVCRIENRFLSMLYSYQFCTWAVRFRGISL